MGLLALLPTWPCFSPASEVSSCDFCSGFSGSFQQLVPGKSLRSILGGRPATKLTSHGSSRSLPGTEPFGMKGRSGPCLTGPLRPPRPRSHQVGVPPPAPCGLPPGPGPPRSGFLPGPRRPRSGSPQAAHAQRRGHALATGGKRRTPPSDPGSGPFRSLLVPAGSVVSCLCRSARARKAPMSLGNSRRSRDGCRGFPRPLRVPHHTFVCRVSCCPPHVERQWRKRGAGVVAARFAPGSAGFVTVAAGQGPAACECFAAPRVRRADLRGPASSPCGVPVEPREAGLKTDPWSLASLPRGRRVRQLPEWAGGRQLS